MNYIDVILVVLILLSIWQGVRNGFIQGILELICWLGALIIAFKVYPYIVSFFQKNTSSSSLWSIALSFVVVFFLIRLIFSIVATRISDRIPIAYHLKPLNKVSGIFPGTVSGLIYAALAAVLILLMPISPNITTEARESRLASKLSGGIEKLQRSFSPDLDSLNQSLTRITIAPGSKESIKLDFTVQNSNPRPDLEKEMLLMVNNERRKRGLIPLMADTELTQVARSHSSDMFSKGYFSHFSPEGASPFDRLRKAEVRFLTAGENLALAQTLDMAHTGLMNSPGHKANILHKSFGRLGIGIQDGGRYGLMVTQNFRN